MSTAMLLLRAEAARGLFLRTRLACCAFFRGFLGLSFPVDREHGPAAFDAGCHHPPNPAQVRDALKRRAAGRANCC